MNSFIYFAAAMLLLAVASPAAARCPTRSLGNRVCAVLYDDEDCSGWELEVSTIYLFFIIQNSNSVWESLFEFRIF